jgi:hypothetical protein
MANKYFAVHSITVGGGKSRKNLAPGAELTGVLEDEALDGLVESGAVRVEEVAVAAKKTRKRKAAPVDDLELG